MYQASAAESCQPTADYEDKNHWTRWRFYVLQVMAIPKKTLFSGNRVVERWFQKVQLHWTAVFGITIILPSGTEDRESFLYAWYERLKVTSGHSCKSCAPCASLASATSPVLRCNNKHGRRLMVSGIALFRCMLEEKRTYEEQWISPDVEQLVREMPWLAWHLAKLEPFAFGLNDRRLFWLCITKSRHVLLYWEEV